MRELAIVTGAGTGLGQAVALALAEMPMPVIGVGRRPDPLRDTAARSSSPMDIVSADVAGTAGRRRIRSALGPGDRVRFLVHAAGLHAIERATAITPAGWRRVLGANVDARLFLTLELLPWLTPGSRVLFVGSNSATKPRRSATAYCVSQAGSQMLQRCLSLELAPLGIAVGAALPSPVDTPMVAAQTAADPALYPDAADYRRLRDTGALIAPATVARFYRWLLTATTAEAFRSRAWSIHDAAHHAHWLKGADLYASGTPPC